MMTAEPAGTGYPILYPAAATVQVCGLAAPVIADSVTRWPPTTTSSGKSSAKVVQSGPDGVATENEAAPAATAPDTVEPSVSSRPDDTSVSPAVMASLPTRYGASAIR